MKFNMIEYFCIETHKHIFIITLMDSGLYLAFIGHNKHQEVIFKRLIHRIRAFGIYIIIHLIFRSVAYRYINIIYLLPVMPYMFVQLI